MKHPNTDTIVQEAERYSSALDTAHDPLMDWYTREKLFKQKDRTPDSYASILEEMPQEWTNYVLSELVYAHVFSRPQLIKKFLGSAEGEELPKEVRSIISGYRQAPWRYCLLRVQKRYTAAPIVDGLDLLTEELFTFRSDSLKSRSADYSMALGLLFPSGPCKQMMGIVHQWKGYRPEDIITLADILVEHGEGIPPSITSASITTLSDYYTVITENPLPFLLLDRFAEIPRQVFRGAELFYIEQNLYNVTAQKSDFENTSVLYHDNAFEDAENKKMPEEDNDTITLSPGVEGPDLLFTVIYYKKDRRLLVKAHTDDAFENARNYLHDNGFSLPETPDYHISFNAATLISRLCPGALPEWEKPAGNRKGPTSDLAIAGTSAGTASESSDSEGGGSGPELLDTINTVLREVMDRRNHGKPYDVRQIAKKHGLDDENIKNVEGMLESVHRKQQEMFAPAISGGFDDFVPPPPAQRHHLSRGIAQNDVFLLDDSEEVNTMLWDRYPLFQFILDKHELLRDNLVDLDKLGSCLDDAAMEYWKDSGFTVISYTFMLLHHYGEEYRPVRDYAVEILKLFHQVLVQENKPIYLKRFVRRYRMFVYEILLPFGIVECKENPTNPRKVDFDIMSGELFREWVTVTIPLGRRQDTGER